MKQAIFCAACAAYVAGCAGVTGDSPMQALDDSIRLYNENVRWQKWEVAANFLPQKERSKWVDESDERGKDLKVTEYDVVRVMPQGQKAADVQVKVSWYKNSEGTVHETHEMQKWQKKGKQWLMIDESRLRGTEMPGLAEPPLKKDKADGSDGSDGDADADANAKSADAAPAPGTVVEPR